MGPILGIIFGSQVRDFPLVFYGFFNETVALTGCLVIGLLIGLFAGFTPEATANWPTQEMESRGNPVGLLTGIAVAIPSGAGVCLSIIGGNTSSLVGVAISASLLPPAVNAGICFMHAILLKAGAVATESEKSSDEIAFIGGISFALTVVNIICIWVSGIIMFHIKEVSPTENKGAFWARDIRLARELNAKGKTGDQQPPVDTSAIRNGLVSALSKKKLMEDGPTKPIKIKPPRRQPVRTYSQSDINAAFAFKPKKRKPSTFPGESLWWRDLVATAPATEEEDAEYVGLEDMAALFAEEEEDDEDNVIIWTRYGRGRYI